MMRRILVVLLFVALSGSGWASSVAEANLSSQVLLTAELSGSQVVPAVQTQARGVVAVLLNFQKDSAYVLGSVAGLTSAITGIHFHRGRVGENGDVVLDLSTALRGNIVATATRLSMLPRALIAAALTGELYAAVHTVTNPGGELRGQLHAETDLQFSAMLSGGEQTPPIMTNASGMVVAALRQDGKRLRIWAAFQGVGQVTGAHLHSGSRGTSGPVVADLSGMVQGNVIVGDVDASSFADALVRGDVYLNIHTASYPNGELRGQLALSTNSQLAFELWLDGDQQTPPVQTQARGVGRLWLNTSLDTLSWEIYVAGLSGTEITGAHLHRGKVGASGDVLVDLSGSVQQNGWIRGSSTNVNEALIEALLEGQVYLNVHTRNNPNGEIRGQVWRLLREGFVAVFDGMPQVPPVMTTASGSGIVSIDRSGTSVHYHFVLNGMLVQAAHFHKGKRGENGDVLFDLSNSVMPIMGGAEIYGYVISGYWTRESTPPLDDQAVALFFADSVYVNVHTAMHPNGEVRAQPTRQYAPLSSTSPVEEGSVQVPSVYPNPATTTIMLPMELASPTTLDWQIINVRGEEVLRGTLLVGSGSVALDVSSLPAGYYVVTCTAGTSDRRVYRFLKQ